MTDANKNKYSATRISMEVGGKNVAYCENHILLPIYDYTRGHTHHHLELNFIKSGHGIYYVGNKKYNINPGDFYLFNNIENHGLKVIGDEPLENLVIHFEPRLIWASQMDGFSSRYLNVFFNRPVSFSNRLSSSDPLSNQLKDLMLSIEKEFNQMDTDFTLMVKLNILKILILLQRYYGNHGTINTDQDYKQRDLASIEKVIYFMQSHYHGTIKLNDLANLVYMNPSYFSRFFKKVNGLSPMDYLSRVRIQEASKLLLNTDSSILEIACQCGFNNATNFNKTFKKIQGCRPSTYRKMPNV